MHMLDCPIVKIVLYYFLLMKPFYCLSYVYISPSEGKEHHMHFNWFSVTHFHRNIQRWEPSLHCSWPYLVPFLYVVNILIFRIYVVPRGSGIMLRKLKVIRLLSWAKRSFTTLSWEDWGETKSSNHKKHWKKVLLLGNQLEHTCVVQSTVPSRTSLQLVVKISEIYESFSRPWYMLDFKNLSGEREYLGR